MLKIEYPMPEEMSRSEIEATIEAWVAAAKRAEKAGFDQIQIHGAHGYLIQYLLSSFSVFYCVSDSCFVLLCFQINQSN